MARDPRYDILFEPVDRSRHHEEPLLPGAALHRHGLGPPRTLAEMRGVKAEGGWGVVYRVLLDPPGLG
jgi:dimethylamine/trimethylamine dehydrogenase